jgi:hypothetical protein
MIITLNHFTSIESSMKLALRNTILLVATVGLVASCASVPPTIVRETVGPSPAVAVAGEDNGFLTVYSATAWMTDGDGPLQLRHTNYEIDSADGTLLQVVSNGDDEPSRVTLPKGVYTVAASSDTSGEVRVPVAIEAGKITVVRLETERDWKEASAGIPSVNLVRLPNGQPIGFRAPHAEFLKRPIMAVAQSK